MATRKERAMVTRIDRLTKEQEGLMPEWRDKWIRIGLSTEPADRQRFENAVARCYLAARLSPPKAVIWVESPVALALGASIAAGLVGAVAAAVASAVAAAVVAAVRSAVDSAVGSAVDSAVDSAVRSAVG